MGSVIVKEADKFEIQTLEKLKKVFSLIREEIIFETNDLETKNQIQYKFSHSPKVNIVLFKTTYFWL